MSTKLGLHLWLAILLCTFVIAIGCSTQPAPDQVAKNDSSPKTAVEQTKTSGSKPAPDVPDASKPDASSNSNQSQAAATTPAEPIDAATFPRPDNAEKAMYTSATSTVMFHQPGNVKDQAEFYDVQLKKLGWQKAESSEIVDGVGFLDYTKGKLSITVTINPLREGMITTIAQGSGVSVPASLEEGDDDF